MVLHVQFGSSVPPNCELGITATRHWETPMLKEEAEEVEVIEIALTAPLRCLGVQSADICLPAHHNALTVRM